MSLLRPEVDGRDRSEGRAAFLIEDGSAYLIHSSHNLFMVTATRWRPDGA